MTYRLPLTAFIVLAGSAAFAQEPLFAGPRDSTIRMSTPVCGTDGLCVEAPPNADGTARALLLPEWVAQGDLIALRDDPEVAAYLQGMSDGAIIDICEVCQCCEIQDDRTGVFFDLPHLGGAFGEGWTLQ